MKVTVYIYVFLAVLTLAHNDLKLKMSNCCLLGPVAFSIDLTLLHSERPKLDRVLAVLSAIGLKIW